MLDNLHDCSQFVFPQKSLNNLNITVTVNSSDRAMGGKRQEV